MNLFEKIKHYYELGYYQKKHIERLFLADVITREQYNEILGVKKLETETQKVLLISRYKNN